MVNSADAPNLRAEFVLNLLAAVDGFIHPGSGACFSRMMTRPVRSNASYASTSRRESSSRTNSPARSASVLGARFWVISMRNSNARFV